jgi:hypothetical protein
VAAISVDRYVMKTFWVFLASFFFTVYEILLIMLAVNTGNFSINIWKDLPLFQSNTEFILVLGQVPVIALFAWWYSRRKKALEKDFLEKYRKKDQ